MTRHSDYARLRDRLEAVVSPTAFRGTLYRACDPIYANTSDLLTGEGSRRYGGRWNVPGSFAAVYLAMTIEGAVAEALGLASHYGFDPASRLPLTLVAVDVALPLVIDMTTERVRRALRTSLARMRSCDWRSENADGRESLTQAMGCAAFELGAQAVIVPSAVKRGWLNLDVFPDNLGGTGRLAIRSAGRLPPPPAPGGV